MVSNNTNIDKLINLVDTKTEALSLVLQSSLELYIKTMFKIINETDFMFEPFHKTIIKKLEDIAYQRNKKRNLIVNVSVGSGKSLLIEYFISWCFARSKNKTFIYTSHSDRLIMSLSKETKELCENPYWVKLFKHQTKLDQKSKANWSFQNSKNRTGLTAGAMGSSLTGLDAGNPNIKGFSGALIIDDPQDAVKVQRYPLYRKDINLFYTDKLESRRRTPDTPTILIMQRLNKDDLTGHLLSVEKDLWDVVKIPALQGDRSFWEKRYPIAELKKIQSTNPYKFSCQYQQDPITTGGQVIKTDWFKYYQDYNQYKYKRLFITADTAQKTKEHNDWSVFCLWGLTNCNKLLLIDMIRDKWEAPDLEKNAKHFWEKWSSGINGRRCSSFYVEDKSSGTGLIQSLKSKYFIPITAVPRHTDKLTRLEDVLGYIASGQVFLPISSNYSFNPVFISECESISRDMSHLHDDMVDCLIDAIDISIGNRKVSILDAL